MKRFLLCFAAVLFFSTSDFAQSYGLIFSSHEVVQEKRTSLDLSPDDSLCFNHSFRLSFDINFLPRHEIYFGYVFRIIAVGPGGNDQNVDLIYNQRLMNFKLIIGENFSGIGFAVDSLKLYRDWSNFVLSYDLDKHLLRFSVNGRPVGSAAVQTANSCFKFLWGANDYGKFRTRDIPPMQIKDIRIDDNGASKYSWPLDETSGETALDKLSRHPARIKNPVWLKPRFQQWDGIGSFTLNGYAGVAYDPKQDKLYVPGADSIAIYTFTKDGYTMDWMATRHINQRLGHQDVFDTAGNRLLDIYVDRRDVSVFSFGNRQWDQELPEGPLTEYWHANKFVSPLDTSLYVIGGYGQLRYKNQVQRYRFATHSWDTVRTSGDYLPPRYLSALGADPQGKYAYIVGGYGSQTGDQMLDPRNYYDFFRYDVGKHSFRKLYSLKPLSFPFAFANSLVLTGTPGQPDGAWYALIFPNDSYNSQLQLIEGSLADSSFRLAGNTIPYRFHDVQSFADLYYSPLSNKLIAVTLFYTLEEEKQRVRNTQVRVYTLNYPPGPVDKVSTVVVSTPGRSWRWDVSALAVVILVFVLGFYFLRRRRNRQLVVPDTEMPPTAASPLPAANLPVEPTDSSLGASPAVTPAAWSVQEVAPPVSAIYLFGPYQTVDREGHDCTRLFTPLLKELFLIIATYTFRNGRGISSEGLNEILWHDKAEKDAKNNRSVNLAKLKPILEKIGGCSINRESGYWQLQVPDDAYVDYKACVALLQDTAVHTTAKIQELVRIIKRGPFLFQTEYNWLDDIKSEVSNGLIDYCAGYLHAHDITENPELTIEIANCIFYFDQLNEDALIFKCKGLILLKRHNLASNTYLKFVKDYRDIYSAEFDKTFQEIIA